MNLLGLIGVSLALGVLSWLAFLWSVKSGQYEDPEGPKYRMLDDEDEEPPAGPAPRPPPSTAAGTGDDPPRSGPGAPTSGQSPGGS